MFLLEITSVIHEFGHGYPLIKERVFNRYKIIAVRPGIWLELMNNRVANNLLTRAYTQNLSSQKMS